MRKTTNSKRAAVLPLGIKNRVKTELPALVALAAIGEPWFSEQHQSDLLVVALVVRELAPAASDQAQCAAALQQLCEQVITAENKIAIALNLAECLPWLQVQPNARIERALKAVAARHLAQEVQDAATASATVPESTPAEARRDRAPRSPRAPRAAVAACPRPAYL